MKTSVDPQQILSYIQQFQLEQLLSPSDSLPIQLRYYEQDEVVLHEGDELDGLYFQVAGRTKVSSSVTTGKALLLRFCGPLSVFGDVELIQKVAIQSQVEAIEASAFLFVNKRAIESELRHNIPLLHELLRHLSYKLLTCTTASRINLLASVEERFASYLLSTRLQHPFGKEIQTPHIAEIASLIGTTPRHLNRVVTSLSKIGVIMKEKKKISVQDWKKLDAISNGLRYE
ncbi:Crp/Fnr family transcriptional regulator [Paenibacillus paeoniae]|uniref:Crp/Fnr family transcriptional regulator n=1 Tax=Paenibacillus paeoniae TaxID=2292705 RepID=A0A371PKP5_9BACL|nr:Crp/Fnr family transcriptional regulator [Paenibacillus paeoniae]REK76768.1 Crp/Fnr family transcriptional regulator [Paenibacillus paeoniae]